jgi:hypothetical protein
MAPVNAQPMEVSIPEAQSSRMRYALRMNAMRRWLLAVALATSLPGCTSAALERQSLDQTISLTDLRLREAMGNLAMVAENPSALPTWSSIYAGTADVNDSGTVTSSTVPFVRSAAKPAGYHTTFGTESLDLPCSRTVKLNWTLDPSVAPEKIRAMRCACRCAVYGPNGAMFDYNVYLTKPAASMIYPLPGPVPQFRLDAEVIAAPPPLPGRFGQLPSSPPPGAGFYFDVADQLLAIPPGWLHVGCKKEMPHEASYWGSSHDAYVWVMPDGVQSLTNFTLIMQEIARVQLASTYYPPAVTRKVLINVTDPVTGLGRAVTAYIDAKGFLVSGDGAAAIQLPVRRDNVANDPALRSQIANAKSTQ